MSAGDRLKCLRAAVGLTQDGFAAASQAADPDARLTRVDVVQIETHRNKATSHRIRRGVAAAVGARVDDVASYLDGAIDLTEMLRLIERRRTESGEIPATRPRRFSDRAEWQAVSDEARRLFPTVPERFFAAVGDYTDHLPGPLDSMFVGEFARMLAEHSARTSST